MRQVLVLLFFLNLIDACAQNGLSIPADTLFATGEKLYRDGKYSLAADTLEQAIALYERSGNLSGRIKAQQLRGECFANLARCDEALSILSATLALAQSNFENETSEVAESFYYLARATGGCAAKWDEAIALMHRSSALKKKVYGENTPNLALNHTFMGYMQHHRAMYDSALFYLQKALDIRNAESPVDEVELSNVLFHLGNTYSYKGNLVKALELQLQSLAIRERKLGPDHASLSNTITSIGRIYQRLGNDERALESFLKGLEIRKQSLGPDHGNVAASYYMIGTLYSDMHNFHQAIEFIQQGNRITEKIYGQTHDILPTYYAYLGRLFGRIGEHEETIRFFDKAVQVGEQNMRKDHPYLGLIYNIIAEYYADDGDLAKTNAYVNKALPIFRKSYGEGSEREASLLARLAGCYLRDGQREKAMDLYKNSQSMLQERFGEIHPKLSGIYHLMGIAASKNGDYEVALEYLWKGLSCTSANADGLNNPFVNPPLDKVEDKFTALSIAATKVGALFQLARRSQDEKLFRDVLNTSDFCMALIDQISSGYNSENERTELERISRQVYDNGIGAAFALFEATGSDEHVERAFVLSEKSKATMLVENLRDAHAKELGGVPDSLVEEERDLKILLAYHQNNLYQAQKANKQTEIEMHRQLVFETDQALEALKRSLEINFPKYYQNKYAGERPDLAEIRRNLSANAALLEYYVGDTTIFAVGIVQGELRFVSILADNSFKMAARDYDRSLTDVEFILNSRDSADLLYTRSASFLYDKLVEPLIRDSEVSELIIVPDGMLAQINFGTLLTEKVDPVNPRYNTLPYLLHIGPISYTYSTLSIQPTLKERKRPREFFAGFAPSYPGSSFASTDSAAHPVVHLVVRNGRLPLPGAQQEVERISALMGGDSWIDKEATETNFKRYASRYAVLHMAMHSFINNENPNYSELLFNPENDDVNDGYLTVAEIYNLNLNARMVVLSACSSGTGKIRLGEGPITLSRAFSYSGCPSVVMSLWKIPDDVTADIMSNFYDELKNGKDKHDALREAQRRFLSETTDPMRHHPYFWGGFVVMGDTEPLPGRPIWHILVPALVVLLAALILLARSRKMRRLRYSEPSRSIASRFL